MHRHLKKWYKSLKIKVVNGRYEFKDGLIFDIRSDIWTTKNKKIYKIKFTPQLYKYNEVKIFYLKLPYGIMIVKRARQIISP